MEYALEASNETSNTTDNEIDQSEIEASQAVQENSSTAETNDALVNPVDSSSETHHLLIATQEELSQSQARCMQMEQQLQELQLLKNEHEQVGVKIMRLFSNTH